MKTGYFSVEGFEEQLENELSGIYARYGRLFLAEGKAQKVYWAQNIWHNLEMLSFRSISEAANLLRDRGALWALYPHQYLRRAELISERLPHFSPKPIRFGSPLPQGPLGSWTLLDEHTLLAASACTSSVPHGEMHFEESKEPPSRAYLKLWEILTRIGKAPKAGEKCLEVGASPGSWTWALLRQGATVTAVDRAPLELPPYPLLHFLKQDAFALDPDPNIDWVFSDVICPPEKLLAWLHKWLDAGCNPHFICTLKFQGKTDYGIVREFEQIKNSHIVHLFHNKHELTWYRLRSDCVKK